MIDVKKKVLIICGDDVHDIIFMCASKRSQSNLNNILITFLFVFCFCEEKMSVRKSYNHYRIALVVVSLLLLRSSNPRLLSSISAFGMILNHRFTVTQTTTSSYLRLLLPVPSNNNLSRLISRLPSHTASKNHRRTTIISMSTSTSINTNINSNTINILCLHGKGNNGNSFRNALEPLEERLLRNLKERKLLLDCNFDYLDAPFPMNDDKLLQWWTLPPGIRSFNAKEYVGFERSSKLVQDALQTKQYHYVFGHSQGAILLSALLSSDSYWKKKNATSTHPPPIGYILNGCAWPNPFTDQLESFQYPCCITDTMRNKDDNYDANNNTILPQILFVIGRNDTINPADSAESVRDLFIHNNGGLLRDSIETIYHPGGHSVPVYNEKAVTEIVQWIISKTADT